MRLEAAKLLEDIRVAAADAVDMAAGKSYDDFRTDKQLRYAIERCFEIAGEALAQLNKLDPPTAQRITDWRAIIGFRNVLIHGYAVVRHDKTWDIVTSELPVLLREVTAMLDELPGEP
ncbi:MAG TPA: HepT-like ribonuclease domain-containing protein [Tepidisphaeraceae bacterium]|nr:HepT-like ribonuclease domain-containing protein [Tepidisphaeraceae bacterium]